MSPPKKASNQGKNKTIDGYISNANVSEFDANDSCASGALAEPKAGTPDDKSEMYKICQEICQTISKSILEKLDERFDAFEAKFQSVLSVQADLQNRLEGQELAVNAMDERMGVLEAKCEELAKLVNQFQPKLLDLEARSRRLNIKIVGIKEGSEEGRPTEFISNLIPELLGKEHFPYPLKVDRAHRSLWPMPAAGEKPRTIIACIHHFQTKELILRLARMKKMEYKGNKVLIFPDYTSEVMSQRRSFRNVMQALREDGIKFQLRYPAKLRVYWKGGDVPEVFNHPAQAEAAHQQKKHSATEKE